MPAAVAVTAPGALRTLCNRPWRCWMRAARPGTSIPQTARRIETGHNWQAELAVTFRKPIEAEHKAGEAGMTGSRRLRIASTVATSRTRWKGGTSRREDSSAKPIWPRTRLEFNNAVMNFKEGSYDQIPYAGLSADYVYRRPNARSRAWRGQIRRSGRASISPLKLITAKGRRRPLRRPCCPHFAPGRLAAALSQVLRNEACGS